MPFPKLGLLVICASTLSACASLKDSRLSLAAGAGAIGAFYGSQTAPVDQTRESHAALSGAALASFGFILGELLFSDQSVRLEQEKQNLILKQRLSHSPPAKKFKTVFTYSAPTVLGKNQELQLPSGTQVLVFQTDDWKWIDEQLYHQNLLYEFHLPEKTK